MLNYVLPIVSTAESHPCLLFGPADWDSLVQRADREPWASMKRDALQTATLPLESDATGRLLAYRDRISKAALAWLLDEQDRPLHRVRLTHALDAGLAAALKRTEDGSHGGTVFPANVAFEALLAMDVAHADLPREKLIEWEELVVQIEGRLSHGWRPHRDGVRLALARFRGDPVAFMETADRYIREMRRHITQDGVHIAGSGYAVARYSMTDRQVKHLGLDIIQHALLVGFIDHAAGIRDVYKDDRLRFFYEWLYGYAADPTGRLLTFGDTFPRDQLWGHILFTPGSAAAPFRVSRLSHDAARYAAYHYRQAGASPFPEGLLLNYILTDEALPFEEAALPPSRIFPQGGAFLLGEPLQTETLYAALWNVPSAESHTHKEVNALAITGYGEPLLVNAGYAGWGDGLGDFTWKDVNDNARQANTLLVDGQDHVRKTGAGVTRGFTGAPVEFATGDSGNALHRGIHLRSLVHIKARTDAGGYWFLHDKMHQAQGARDATLIFRPHATGIKTIADKEAYGFRINKHTRSHTGAGATMFFATVPTSVNTAPGAFLSWGQSFVLEQLEATFPIDAKGLADVMTVIYPHSEAHPPAHLSRLQGQGFSGARVSHARGATDTVLESLGNHLVEFHARTDERIVFQGRTIWYRHNAEQRLDAFFLRNGRSFRFEADLAKGLASDTDVDVYFDVSSGSGRIAPREAASVTIFHPRIAGMVLNGTLLPPVETSDGQATFPVPAIQGVGAHTFEWVLE